MYPLFESISSSFSRRQLDFILFLLNIMLSSFTQVCLSSVTDIDVVVKDEFDER